MLCFFYYYCKKQNVRAVLAVFSFVKLVCGLLALLLAFKLRANEMLAADEGETNPAGIMWLLVLLFGLFLILLALFGFLTAYMANCLVGFVYGIVALLVSLLFFIIAIVMIVASANAGQFVEDFCNGTYD